MLKNFKTVKRGFFNFFKKKPKQEYIVKEPQYRDVVLETHRKIFNEKNKEITPTEKYYMELREKRELYEKEKIERQQQLEEAINSYQREQETTIRYLDYKSIILNNINIFPINDFSSLDEFIHYFMKFNFLKNQFTEENFIKIVKAFNFYSDVIDEQFCKTPYFQNFLDYMKKYIYGFKESKSLVEVIKFMDLFCINYPELWAKCQQKMFKQIDFSSIEEIIEILASFSNQGEGDENFYDQLEQKIHQHLVIMTLSQLNSVLQSFFNMKAGSQKFIKSLLQQIEEKIKDTYLSPSMAEITKISLIICFLQDEVMQIDKKNIFIQIEKCVLRNLDKISFSNACNLGKAFGSEEGSKNFSQEILKIAIQNFDTMTLEQFKEFLEGFVFTYKISLNTFKKTVLKIEGFLNELNPSFLARFAKTLFMYEQETLPIVQEIEKIFLHIFRNNNESLTAEDLYQIVLCYTMTRIGSREFYRVLEYNILDVIKRVKLDQEFCERIYRMFQESGLCSVELLGQLEQLTLINNNQ